jgi:hypothetical protein
VSTETTGFVCLYFGSGEDCRNCGGWLKAAGGPFDGDSRYCSEDCFADAQERESQYAQRMACCPECGYDNQEHAPECSNANPLCPGGCGCRLGTDDADARECGCDGGCCGDE